MRKKSVVFLFFANWILLIAGWVAALIAYPNLPQKIPLWLDFFGHQSMMVKKSPLFFLFVSAQTLFLILFMAASRILPPQYMISWKKRAPLPTKEKILLSELMKEYMYLSLIFFNLIFIHIQTSIIFLAYQAEKGFNKFYFFTLLGIILILIPNYRLRKRLLMKKGTNGRTLML